MQLRQTGITWQVVGDDVVVLDLTGSVYLKLNGSGRFLWERLAEGTSEPELVVALTERFDVDEVRARADVESFLGDARRRDLIVE